MTMKLSSRTILALALVIAIYAIAGAPHEAHAIDPKNPDWPCVQRKVHKLTPAQLWDGPEITETMPWRNSNDIRNLVKILMSRRVPIEDAEKAIEKFIATVDAAKKDEQLTLLFGGFLDQTNARRSKIVSGIEKMNRRQRARAEELERQGVELAKMEDGAVEGDPQRDAKLKKAQTEYDWDARVFKERQDNLPLACEIPVLIEQHAFEVARTIRNHMDN